MVLLRIYFNSFIPEKYHNIIFADDSLERYEAKVLNHHNKWYILNDRLKTLPSEELENIVNSLNSESERRGFHPNAFLNEKTIYRGATPATDSFLNKIAEMKGTFMCPICLVGSKDVNIGFEFDDTTVGEVTTTILDFIKGTKLKVDVVKMGHLDDFNVSSFKYFHELSNYDLSGSSVISFRIFKSDNYRPLNDEQVKCITLKPKFLGIRANDKFNSILIGRIEDEDIPLPLIQKNPSMIENKKGRSIELDGNLFPPLSPFLILANELTMPVYLWFNVYTESYLEANFVIHTADMNYFLKKLTEKVKDVSNMGFTNQLTYVGRASDYF